MTDTMQPYSTTEYTVLRIKRKATEPPLSSLGQYLPNFPFVRLDTL